MTKATVFGALITSAAVQSPQRRAIMASIATTKSRPRPPSARLSVPMATHSTSAQRHRWKLHHMAGNPGRGEGREAVYRLYAEISLMVRANWTICTFSSNVARLVQVLREQPEETMSSLDAEWYPG